MYGKNSALYVFHGTTYLPRGARPCSPVSDVAKHERSDQNPQHEGGLAQLGQPLILAHQVPVRHDALVNFSVVVNKVPIAGCRRFVAIKVVRKVFGVDAQGAAALAELPLRTFSRLHHQGPGARLEDRQDVFQARCRQVAVQDIGDVARHAAHKVWRLH